MIYLDYAAHTPADEAVLKAYYEANIDYIGNPNSSHLLGQAAGEFIRLKTSEIAEYLNVRPDEIIYTSGATEANNLAIKGIAGEYKRTGKHIITSYLEHASVTGPIVALQNQGFDVDFVQIQPNGSVDFNHLKELIRKDTILVSLCYVDSEVGTIQPINEIGMLLKQYPDCHFHVDATQAVGKVPVISENVDVMTLSPHKFHGINGSGLLIRKDPVQLEPQLHGGNSTTVYRSGTPVTAHAASTASALSLVIPDLQAHFEYVQDLNRYVRGELSQLKSVIINSPENASPYILNISTKGKKAEDIIRQLEQHEIYLSGKSACCAVNTPSRPVYAITKDRKRALSTIRISFSYKTTREESDSFLECFKSIERG